MLMVLLRKAVCHQLVEMLCFIERERLFFKLVAQLFQLRDWWKSWSEAPAVVFGHQRSIFWAFPVTLPLSALRFTSINNDPPCVIISQVFSLSLSFFYLQQQPLIIGIICLTTPLLITCFSYLAIWRKRRRSPENVRSFRQNQEARFSKSIFLVTAASFLTWTPFLVVHIIVLVTVYLRIPLFVIFCIVLVHFSNSFVNFIIYIIRFPSYRKALLSLSRCSVL